MKYLFKESFSQENHVISSFYSNTQNLSLSQLQYDALKRAISAPEILQFYIIPSSSISDHAEWLDKMQSEKWD